ncbi:MAG: PKD domain-containing protein, partial [Actinomycetota bacterium]|nr:PKD domain-containing protein [Actinomycetota bacterium]
MTVTGTHFTHNGVFGAGGGESATGGNGAFGGYDGNGDGTPGSNGGANGEPGASGAGLGGAIYDAGRSTLSGLSFTGDVAQGGSGLTGGFHHGGNGGGAPAAEIVNTGPPDTYGNGGDAADGADGGKATGGAYFGSTTPTNSLASQDSVQGGQPGPAGTPGAGAPGGGTGATPACVLPNCDPNGIAGHAGTNGSPGAAGVVGSASGADFSTDTPLTIDFTVAATPGEPGGRDFTASANTDGQGNPLALTWDFGDGASAPGGPVIHHDYVKPGPFTVTLTATNANAQMGTATHSVTIAAPTLSDSVVVAPAATLGCNGASTPPAVTPSDLNPDPGQQLVAAVEVTAGTDGVGDLSQLVFTGDPLLISPTGRLTVISGPDPAVAGPFSLSPGQEMAFTYCLTTVTLGPGNLSSQVSGQDDSGAAVVASGHQLVPIGQHLAVSVTATPNPITVTDDPNGNPVPVAFQVAVTVTNPFTKSLTDVTIARPLALAKVGATKTIPVTEKGDTSPGTIDLGPIGPGASATTHIAFSADVDGSVTITANASAANPDSPAEVLNGVG